MKKVECVQVSARRKENAAQEELLSMSGVLTDQPSEPTLDTNQSLVRASVDCICIEGGYCRHDKVSSL